MRRKAKQKEVTERGRKGEGTREKGEGRREKGGKRKEKGEKRKKEVGNRLCSKAL